MYVCSSHFSSYKHLEKGYILCSSIEYAVIVTTEKAGHSEKNMTSDKICTLCFELTINNLHKLPVE